MLEQCFLNDSSFVAGNSNDQFTQTGNIRPARLASGPSFFFVPFFGDEKDVVSSQVTNLKVPPVAFDLTHRRIFFGRSDVHSSFLEVDNLLVNRVNSRVRQTWGEIHVTGCQEEQRT